MLIQITLICNERVLSLISFLRKMLLLISYDDASKFHPDTKIAPWVKHQVFLRTISRIPDLFLNFGAPKISCHK